MKERINQKLQQLQIDSERNRDIFTECTRCLMDFTKQNRRFWLIFDRDKVTLMIFLDWDHENDEWQRSREVIILKMDHEDVCIDGGDVEWVPVDDPEDDLSKAIAFQIRRMGIEWV